MFAGLKANLSSVVLTTVLIGPLAFANADQLTTLAQTSSWKKTGRYAEVERLCKAFAEAHPKNTKCKQFGETAEGRPLLALIVSDGGYWSGAEARKAGRPVVLFQGAIHAGEVDGKDAGFQFLRDWLDGTVAKGTLTKVTAVFVPVFNADGHERFAKNNRPNQNGPEEMGWRTTARNLNLNRDYVKAEAPEMQAMLRLLNEWDPVLLMDLHVTDGAEFQHGVGFVVEPADVGDSPVKSLAKDYRELLVKRLKSHLPLPFYPDFRKRNDPLSGVELAPSSPRFSQSYWSQRNRVGVLVETHSWKDYPTRVRITYDTLVASIEILAKQGKTWLKRTQEGDRRAARLSGAKVPLTWDVGEKFRTIDFLGYEFSHDASEISGQTRVRYDKTKPTVWKVPLFEDRYESLTVQAPKQGYVVPKAHRAWIEPKLVSHGIVFSILAASKAEQKVESFLASDIAFSKESFEGRMQLSVKGAWRKDSQTLTEGSLFVPIAQPKARLVLHLLEPIGPDSLVAWGFFNAHFEKKEYLEDYVAEEVARELLQRPEVKKEFFDRLAKDSAFAKDPDARLEFFHRLHPSWDTRYGLYPIVRVETDPTR